MLKKFSHVVVSYSPSIILKARYPLIFSSLYPQPHFLYYYVPAFFQYFL